MESMAIGKNLASQHGYDIDAGQELLALGLSNLVGAMFSSYPVTGSFSRSAVANSTGAVSQIAGLVTSLVMLCLEIVADQEGRFRSLGHGLPRHACVRCAPGHLVGCCAFPGHRDLRVGEATNHHLVANSWNNHLPEHQAGEQRCIRSECLHRTDWVFDVLCQRLVHQGCPAYLRGGLEGGQRNGIHRSGDDTSNQLGLHSCPRHSGSRA
mmetsp:Transcript_108070/g.345132  ORF Transcript_108070/g.345132 Transcript_108070/m.345132 type:complete len:210 (-) Transcript_108070:670-1299(-)